MRGASKRVGKMNQTIRVTEERDIYIYNLYIYMQSSHPQVEG